MGKYVLHVDLVVYVEADSLVEAEKKFWDSPPIAHYVEGVDVVYGQEIAASSEVDS
jgi:hypothetical protein